jgi:hypothetical protein
VFELTTTAVLPLFIFAFVVFAVFEFDAAGQADIATASAKMPTIDKFLIFILSSVSFSF